MDGLAKRLKERRLVKGWSLPVLAEKIGGQASAVGLSHYEHERRTPSASTLKELAKALGCSSDYLLGLKDKP